MGDVGDRGRIGMSLEGEHEDRAPLCARRRHDRGRQRTGARQHAQRRLHFSILGSVTARMSALRMKSMIERTGRFSG